MPMYSYRCPECGKRFDELLPMDRMDQALCPDCGAKAEREWMGKCNSLNPIKEIRPCDSCAGGCACPHAAACAGH